VHSGLYFQRSRANVTVSSWGHFALSVSRTSAAGDCEAFDA